MEQINSNDKNCLARVLLITANVGTIFENLDVLFEPWMNEFTKKLTKLKPEFIALHMQEIGGKNYKTSMQSIDPFFKKFLSNSCIQHYNRYLIAIDSDFTDENNFTSLCNVYLIHESLKQDDVQLYNFSDKLHFNYTSRQIFSGNLNNNHLIYKERYKKHFFKDFQWSRKGFIQTKWRLKKHDFDFVNIHLFHDPSNLVALNSTPSIYSESRKKALEYSIKKIKENHVDSNDPIMFSIFGDFNFRLDLSTLINDFSNKGNLVEFKDNNQKLLKVVFKASDDKEVFTIEEKKFKWNHNSSIQRVKTELMKYDIELSMFEEPLYEAERNFPPSYPFMEEIESPDEYMESRCPSWCDRIIMNKNFMKFVEKESESTEYGMIGEGVCMGDHKPIYLFFKLHEQKSQTSARHDNELNSRINKFGERLNKSVNNNNNNNNNENFVNLNEIK
ncbi:unnamed protein product [Brachionus calyciflorus]|uniref:inositol-polyphosphate 5-phosphatase n=1 Tax=Brachionus calyciflorus TaxID=104777 RepID=A0A813XHX2_9BILA|nr:unnamed protein product [Brachionus calyciflorus]